MFSTKSILAATAAFSLISSSAALYDANSKSNVALYWGSGANQQRLSTFCDESSVDVIPIGFINVFPGQGNGLIGENFGNACWGSQPPGNAASYYQGPGNDPSKNQLPYQCPTVQDDIPYCQAKGKKILLSLGGASNTYALNGVDEGIALADFLWGAYGPLTPEWKAAGGIRPLDRSSSNFSTSAEYQIDIDGFDFDIEHPSADAQVGYIACIDRLRQNFQQNPSKKYIISGAPQCPMLAQDGFQDANMGNMILASQFDIIWIQFYSNGAAGCTARNWADANPNYPAQQSSMTTLNYQAWKNTINSGASNGAKIYLGLLAGPATNCATPAGYGDFLDATEADHLISAFQGDGQFGGVMLWEATSALNDCECGTPYFDTIKNSLNKISPPKDCKTVTSSTMSTTSSSSSSSTSAPVSTTSSSSTSSSSSSSSVPVSTTSSSSSSSSSSVSTSSSSSSSVATTSSSSSSSSVSSSSSSSVAPTTSSSSSVVSTTSSSVSLNGTTSSTSSSVVSTTSSSSAVVTSSSSSILTTSSSSSSTFLTLPPFQNTTRTATPTSSSSVVTTSSSLSSSSTGSVETPTTSATSIVTPSGTSTDTSVPTSTEVPWTTSTVYTTSVYTVTSCAPTVTNCPAHLGSVTTEVISLYTTVCPVTQTQGNGGSPAGPTGTPAPPPPSPPTEVTQYTTSTVYTTKIYTVTSCAPTVTNCPAKLGSVTTEIVSLYTTVCPVANQTPAPPASSPSAPAVVPSSPAGGNGPSPSSTTTTYVKQTQTTYVTIAFATPSSSVPSAPQSSAPNSGVVSVVPSTMTVIPIPPTTAAPYPTGPSSKNKHHGTGTGTGLPSVSVVYTKLEVSPVPVSVVKAQQSAVSTPASIPSVKATPVPTQYQGAAGRVGGSFGVVCTIALGAVALLL